MDHFDVAVIGLGGIGSAVLYAAARQGFAACGLDARQVPHDRGSSFGATRLIRRSYFEHPAYVPLVDRSFELWRDLERQTGRSLLRRIGLLTCGPADSALVAGVRKACAEHGAGLEDIAERDMHERFPAYRLAAGDVAVYEAEACVLFVEACVRAHLEAAAGAGASLHTGNGDVEVSRSADRYVLQAGGQPVCTANRVVYCCGPWTGGILPSMATAIRVTRKPYVWLDVADRDFSAESGCPVVLWSSGGEIYYIFPRVADSAVKLGRHSGGDGPVDPDSLDRSLRPGESAELMEFFVRHTNSSRPTVSEHAVCMYAMTLDEHFLVGSVPGETDAAVLAGFSGHGFKFAPAMGETVADWLADGRWPARVGFLSPLRRF